MKSNKILLLMLFVLAAFSANASVESLDVTNHGIVGHYYKAPTGSSMKPIIVLGGSEGGIPTRLADAIASNGFPTLALAYFKEDSLPEELEKIPLEYFEKAKTWLQQRHPKQAHITLVGWSKGAELALLLASKDATFDHVVAIAPSSVVWAGILNDWQKVPGSSWTLNNEALPYVAFNPTGPVTGLVDLYSQSLSNRNDDNKASISVENIQGSVFLYSGGMDEIWPSTLMANSICQRMAKNESSRCTHFDFGDLDHLLNYKMLDKSDALYETFIKSVKGG